VSALLPAYAPAARPAAELVDADVVELPTGIDPDRVRTRVTRRYVFVYYVVGAAVLRLNGEPVRLMGVWRWSGLRRRLVPGAARRDRAAWCPGWSRTLAERAWAEVR
jgi:hypothetical protein